MLISYNWLKQYTNLPDSVTPFQVAEKLKLSTVEIENIITQGEHLENIVAGKVLKADKHPNADKLKVCQVDVGKEKLQIVCGGSNVEQNMLVAVAKIGAKVRWHGEGELVEIVSTKIRDVDSYGMICASTEIGLAQMFPLKSEKEIMDLTGLKVKPGMELKKALGLDDVIFEVDNKSLSNRPDLWGHYGLAREISVLYPRELKKYETKEIKPGKEIKLKIKVEDEQLCPRYMAVAVGGVKIGPSPLWLQQRLNAVGLRSINNVVDITNYVMFDLGQPLHAFDAEKIKSIAKKEKTIVIRTANNKEKFKLLDGKILELTEKDLVIADEKKPIALAGVMGGVDSGINENTTTIIFESANFEPVNIRKTALRYDSRTDSSARFEKSLDPNMTKPALEKAVELLLQICPQAKVISDVEDKKNFHLAIGPLQIGIEEICRKIGAKVEQKEIINILTRLGFEVKEKNKDVLSVKIPTWRATKDVSIAEDLVEEVARIYGYDNIVGTLPVFEILPPEKNGLRNLEHRLRNIIVRELGYDEIYSYSFVSLEQIKKLGDNEDKYLELDKPINKEKPYLRRELLSNLLENIQKNIENFDQVNIFEIGKVYFGELAGPRTVSNQSDLLPRQDCYFMAVNYAKKNDGGFIGARLALEKIMGDLKLEFVLQTPRETKKFMHPGKAGEIFVGEKSVGFVFEVSPQTAKAWDLTERIGCLELNLNYLEEILRNNSSFNYQSLPEFPESTRDLAFVVEKKITHREIRNVLKDTSLLLKSIELFDVYEGEHVKAGFKSMAYHFVFSSKERTLNTAEVDEVMGAVANTLKDKIGAEIRK